MADEVTTGKLIWQGEGRRRRRSLSHLSRKGAPVERPIPPDQLAPDLIHSQEVSVDVEFEFDRHGQPQRVRRAGEAWPVSAETIPPKHQPEKPAGPATERRPYASQTPDASSYGDGDFHNPYNFVPAFPRDAKRLTGTGLEDHEPIGHDAYRHNLYSGKLRVRLRVETPLLLPDTAEATVYDDNHKSYPVRVGNDGKPYIAPTAVKGMLRSAYESVTNSRLSVFAKHEARLAYRMEARLGPIPARVERNRQGELVLRIMRTSLPGHAAKLCRYQALNPVGTDKGENAVALRYESGGLPLHGDPVWVEVEHGKVIRIEKRKPDAPPPALFRTRPQPGWACITGPNINNKAYERVFLESAQDQFIRIDQSHESLWRELIINYQETHRADLEKRRQKNQHFADYLGSDPGKTGWSRHVYERNAECFNEETLCYVVFNDSKNIRAGIQALLPVTIARRLYEASPLELLGENLEPAAHREQLSPADRVFGWVNQKGAGAHRSQLRVGDVVCQAERIKGAIETFAERQQAQQPGLPLAILGQPRPQQGRFYVAADPWGTSQEPHLSSEAAGYHIQSNKGLRGRKVYPHHRNLPADYWRDPMNRAATDPFEKRGFFREYRRPHDNRDQEQRDSQNRSIQAWVRPNTIFEFDLHVTNLSAVELGALLWLLSLPKGHYHRLGGGKPLGFGSVGLQLVPRQSDVRLGTDWSLYYQSLDPAPSQQTIPDCVEAYQQAMQNAYGNGETFAELPMVKAFCQAATGFETPRPIHYPRVWTDDPTRHPAPHAEGKSYEWFVANTSGSQYTLPDLTSGRGLPLLEARSQK